MNDYEPSLILNITNLLPDPIVVLDRMGTIQWCNAATFKVTQLAKEDLIGKRFTKLSVLKAVDIPRYIKIFASILKGDSVKHYSATWERKDGTIFETDAQVEPITTPEGKKAILVITRDTTEQKEIHKAYRLARFSIENAADPIFWFDDEANIHYVNTAACKTLSYSNNELSKMTIHDIDPEFSSERWPSFIRELKQNSSLTFESTHITKDRKLFPVEVSVQRLEFEGQVLNFAYVKNIAERKMAEETILRSEEQNRFIVNSMSDLILIYDDDDFLREYYTSDESMLYLPWEQMKDKKPEECMPNTIVETHYELAKIVKETGDHIVYEYELEIRREHRWFQGTMMLHQDKKNLVVAIKEITERKLTQIALEKSEKRFRNLFLNAPVGLFRTNKTGKILECNTIGAKLVGCSSPKEAIEEFNPIDHYINPKRRLELMKELSEFGEVSNFQAEMTNKHGDPIWIEFYSRLYPEEELMDSVVINIIQRKEAEEKLKESEERYRSLVEHMPDVVWTTDMKGRTLYISPNVTDVYGFTSEEIYEAGERLWFGRIHPDDVVYVKQEFEEIFRTGKGRTFEYRIQKKDGEWIWLHDRAYGTYERNGEILASGVFSDITLTKQMEVALKEGEQRFRSVFEQAAVGMARVDKNGQIIEANRKLEEILGYDAGDLAGVNVFEITTPEDSNIERQLSAELLSGKRDSYTMEKRFISKNSSQILGRLTVSLSRDTEGEIDFTIGVLEDITEYKRVQEALATSEARFRSIVKNAGVGITIVDSEDHILEANEKYLELVGYSLDELKQMKISEFTYPEDAKKDAVLFDEIQEGKRDSYLMEKRYIRKDGVTIWGNLTVSVVRNKAGEIEIIVGIVEDITDRKRIVETALRNESRNQVIVEAITDLILIYDEEHYLREYYTSDESLLYLPWEQIKDKRVEEYMPSINAQIHYENVKKVKETGEEVVYEYELESAGKNHWYQSTMMLQKGTENIVAIIKDITERKVLETLLRESEESHRHFFVNCEVPLFRTDIKTSRILNCNPSGAQLLGYHIIKDVVGKVRVSDHYVDPRTRKEFLKELEEKGRVSGHQLHLRNVDGVEFWIEISSTLYPDHGYIESVVIDITNRKQAEDALRASAQRYRELIENLPAGVAIADLNESMTIVNPAFCELVGFVQDELIGKNVLDFISPDDHETIVSETQERKTGIASSYEVQMIRKDGSRRNVKVSAVPHRNDEGQIIGTIGLLTDISEAKRAQESLSASEKRLSDLIEQLPLGVAIANLTERIELVNQAMTNMLGEEREKLIDHNLIDYLVPSYLSKMRDETESRKVGISSTYEVEMIRTDGVKRHVKVSAAPNYDREGRVIGSVGIFEDITDSKRNEAIRLQQESEIDLYSSLLRHDLRNDLGLIMSYIEAVQMLSQSADEEVLSFLISAIASIERMASLLNSFGKPQDVREVDIVEFIREIADEAQEAEKELRVNVSYEKDTSDVKITAGGLLALVFMNLFRNTVQHAGKNPQIEIRVADGKTHLNITVSDNGQGVPKEFEEILFSRGTSSKGEAGGLGLYLSKQIMERSGGSIELLKDTKGAVFLLTIPT